MGSRFIDRHDTMHCPKCGYGSDAHEIHYCGPDQRSKGFWAWIVQKDEDREAVCEVPGEHFHWRCSMCSFLRIMEHEGSDVDKEKK